MMVVFVGVWWVAVVVVEPRNGGGSHARLEDEVGHTVCVIIYYDSLITILTYNL